MNHLIRFFNQRFFWIAFVFLLVSGSLLRVNRYWEFPVVGETQDEMAWTLLGGSLLQTGQPTSWSYFSAYPSSTPTELGGNTFPLVTPALDHPPLFSLLPGGILTLLGKPWNELASSKVVRLPMVMLGIINLALFAWWMVRVRGTSVSTLVGTAFFAFTPAIVFLSRLVVSENLLITWLLVVLLCLSYPVSRLRNVMLFLAQLALPLTKIAGLAIAAATLAATWKDKSRQTLMWASAGLISGTVLLLLYASTYDLALFLEIQTQQSQRDTGMLSLLSTLFWNAGMVNHSFADIWWLFGVVATMGWMFWTQHKKENHDLHRTENTLQILFLAQLAFLLLSVGEQTVHGWYRVVFVPIFAYVIGVLGQKMWDQKQWFGLALVWIWSTLWVRHAFVFVLGTDFLSLQSAVNKAWLVGAGLCVVAWVVGSEKSRWNQRFFVAATTVLVIAILFSQTTTILTVNLKNYWQDAAYIETGLRP